MMVEKSFNSVSQNMGEGVQDNDNTARKSRRSSRTWDRFPLPRRQLNPPFTRWCG